MNLLKATSWAYAAVAYNAMDRLVAASNAPIDHLLNREPEHKEFVGLISTVMDYAKDREMELPCRMPQVMSDAFSLELISQVLALGPYHMQDFTDGLHAVYQSTPKAERDRGLVIAIAVLTVADRFVSNPDGLMNALGGESSGLQMIEASSPEELVEKLQNLLRGGAPKGATLQ